MQHFLMLNTKLNRHLTAVERSASDVGWHHIKVQLMQYCHFLKGFMCVSKQPVHIMNMLFELYVIASMWQQCRFLVFELLFT